MALHLVSASPTDLFEYLHVTLRKVQANNCLSIASVLWQLVAKYVRLSSHISKLCLLLLP